MHTDDYLPVFGSIIHRSERCLTKIEQRYDPENDLPRSQPPVTWAERDLAEAIRELIKAVEVLANKLDALNGEVTK